MAILMRQLGSIIMPAVPPYRRVSEDLKRRIAEGIYPPGSKLPSRKELCVEYEVSDIVIGSAMRSLHDAGLVEPVAGIGVYVRTQATPDA